MADEIENTEAEDQAIEDAAFAATMAESVGDSNTPPAPVEEVKVEDPKDETTADPIEKVLERVEVFDGMTADELKGSLSKVSALQKALDTANGTHGSQLQTLNATIADLKKAKEVETAEPEKESFTRTKGNYPELAVDISADVKEEIARNKLDAESIAALIDEGVEKKWTKKQKEDNDKALDDNLDLLTKAHPDWESVAGISTVNGIQRFNDLKFSNWVATQPEDIQGKIINGSDVSFLTKQIADYKKTLKPTKATKKPDLNLAIIPDGNTQNEQTFQSDDDETEAAYRATMKKLAQG